MTESQCLIVCWYFLPIPVYDGPVSELQITSTSRHLLCRSAANQRASSACCKSFPCSASPPSWRNTRCPTNTAGRGGRALQSLQKMFFFSSLPECHSLILKLESHSLSNIHAKYLKLFYTFLYQTSFFISPSFFLKYKKHKQPFLFFLMWSSLARYSMFYMCDTFCSGYFYCFH